MLTARGECLFSRVYHNSVFSLPSIRVDFPFSPKSGQVCAPFFNPVTLRQELPPSISDLCHRHRFVYPLSFFSEIGLEGFRLGCMCVRVFFSLLLLFFLSSFLPPSSFPFFFFFFFFFSFFLFFFFFFSPLAAPRNRISTPPFFCWDERTIDDLV